ncbi:MAG TPA: efflux RND transporter permease subunit [Pirellulales bacterium]|nr:efflux RND transporter permease subunit [Pirellulales bacterium]HEX4143752.1 efflux RND transporter permease subunit [Pirellulales bacterium]
MNGLIRASLKNPHAVTVMAVALLVIGWLTTKMIPIDILPVFKSPATQTLAFYRGMPAMDMEKSITNRLERGTSQAAGMARLESRSILGVSIIRNYFQPNADPDGALTQVSALVTLEIPTLPPGTLPPVIMPFDPTGTVPVCLVALNSAKESEQVLYDVARYDVRPMIMSNPGAVAPVVFGGTIRTIMLYLDRIRMQARQLAPTDVMKSTDDFNVFLPNGSIKIGDYDYAVASNSLFNYVEEMGDIPLRSQLDNSAFLRDVARPADAAFIQTSVVRVNGRRQVYVPVYRQGGASTLSVVNTLRDSLPDIQGRLSKSDVDLEIVMDQSVYVRNSITALVQEGVLGAVLCSLVILLFLGQWRMTMIAIVTIPLAVVSAMICLYATGQTINVMTLAGLALAIGPLVDSAIICLENTHRHLGLGAEPTEAAFLGASEVAMPELVSTLCTFLVLTPLILVPGMGRFLFQPMAMGVAFAMIAAYFLSRTLVPSYSALFLKPHDAHHAGSTRNPLQRAFARWEALIDRGIALYVRGLDWTLAHRWLTVGIGFGFLAVTLVTLGPRLRREFFPEVDAGAFEIAVRAPTGLRIEATEKRVAQVEDFIHRVIPEHDLQLVVSELGVTPDWSAAYTPNAGPMDAMVRVQLREHRSHSAQEYVSLLRSGMAADRKFADLELSFDAGGMVRGALNEGKSSPLTVRVVGKNAHTCYAIAQRIKHDVASISGVADARIVQRMDYPQFVINVDRAKTAALGLTQADVMRNVVAACNSSVSFNKTNFWIDPATHNQYFVGVQYPEDDIKSIDTLLDIPVTGSKQLQPVPLRSVATLTRTTVPSEITHYNIQPTIELTLNIDGRSLGEVSDDVALLLDGQGRRGGRDIWLPYEPASNQKKTITGSKIVLSGEYARMQETFRNLGVGLLLATLLMYCLMVGLDRSWIVPMTVMLVVPVSLGGVLIMLYCTRTALNVQSLLGIIFVVGIKVANTVLMTDFAQELRRHEGLSPMAAIRKAAAIRVRPVTMTALAAFFAMIPAAIAWERGSEANAPLARAILGGLLAGEPATLFLLPALFAIMVRDKPGKAPGHHAEIVPAEPVVE